MIDDAPFGEGDVGRGLIIREHRDHGTAAARLSEMDGLVRTERDERGASSGAAVEYGDVMIGSHEIGSHGGAHAAESDESNFHK
jgi:hypothetical protein